MKLRITEEIAKNRHLMICQDFLNKLRASKTKSKETPENEFKYVYSWGEQKIASFSFEEAMASIQITKKTRRIEDIIQDRIKRSIVSFVINAGRVSRYYVMETVPVEIIEAITKQEQDRVKEQNRTDLLTPEQRQKEIDNALSQLQKSPGFVCVKVESHYV